MVARKTNGTIWSWGAAGIGRDGRLEAGQLGQGTLINRSSPVQIGALSDWAQISTGARYCLVRKTDGTLWGWGRDFAGNLGQNTQNTARSSPVKIGALSDWAQASAGQITSVAVKTNGTLWAWGLNNNGQVGDGTTINRSSPVQIGALSDWAQVSSGFDCGVAVKTNGTLWTWGYGVAGQLGGGTVINKSSPVQIGALTGWNNPLAPPGGYSPGALFQ
jgi:alpha-tubulin suppressor-like RCC1 family protein